MRVPHRRSLSVISAVSLGAGVLLSATSAQADVYTNGLIEPNTYAYNNGACNVEDTTTGQTDLPIIANAGPVSNTSTIHAVHTNPNDPADTVTQDLTDTTTAELTSTGASVAAMHFSSTGSAATTAPSSTSVCTDSRAGASNDVEADFTVTTPGYLNFTFAVNGPAYGYFYIEASDNNDIEVYVDAEGLKTTSLHSVYLPAGDYEVGYFSQSEVDTSTPTFIGGNTSVKVDATFTPDGTPVPPAPPIPGKGLQVTPSAGKALGYTSLPVARSCATGTLVENVTSSKKAAKTIKKVTVSVDGAPALTVKKPKAGQALTVPVADNGKARTVKTKVTLKKKADQKKAKTFSSAAIYQPCS